MNIREVYNSKTIAQVITETASNKIAMLGAGLFPSQKKMGLDLKWIKGHKGLTVSLMPSSFDAVSTLRSREGFKINETEMAFFRESILLKEKDRQELLRVQEANDPYAVDVLSRLFDDAQTLVDGAEVVQERMRMQLLTPADGSPKISFQADGATYAYNYDPNGEYAEKNFSLIATEQDKWTAVATADPLADVQEAKETVEGETGTTIKYMIVNGATMKLLRQNASIKSAVLAQNPTANVLMTDAKVKELFANQLDVQIIVYNKQYKDEKGVAHKYFADGFATLIPEGALGKTWFGTTPEEADLIGKADVDVTLVGTGVAVATSVSNDPVQTKTTVSEIVLPSYERMDETYVIKCY